MIALRRDRLPAAGLALGVLVAIKPNFGLALLILALAGHRRVAGWGAAAAAGLSLLPLAIYGPDVYDLWLAAVRADLHWVYWADASIIGFSTRMGDRPFGILAAALLAVACVAAARRPGATVMDAAYLGLAASILCSPLGVVPLPPGARAGAARSALGGDRVGDRDRAGGAASCRDGPSPRGGQPAVAQGLLRRGGAGAYRIAAGAAAGQPPHRARPAAL
jgi:hypothetical protein